ncbi:MAG: ABC transporter substrate-binding protein [Candidatus Rokubacteria bacterium]|nr:ABC transporter substrate-binding protein [Candidatus Rokubacteria bacterium]
MVPGLRSILQWSRGGRAYGPVKIGFVYPDTGPLEQAGRDMRDGFLLYWSEVGQKAGGREVELFLETKGTNDTDEGSRKTRKLVERDEIHILGGIVSTPVAYALRAYVIQKEIPTVIMNAGADGLTQAHASEYVFRSSFSNSDASHPLGEWAHANGYRKAVIMAADFRAGHEQIGGFARTFTNSGGQIIQEIYPPLGTVDFSRHLNQIRKDADVVAVFFAGTDALHFVQQYAESALKGKIPLIGKGHTVDDMIRTNQADSALGIVSSLHWTGALDTPANTRFAAAYAQRYQRPPGAYAEQGYVGACMIAKALDVVKGRVEGQRAFLAALKNVEIDAPRGNMKLDDYHNPVHTIYITRVEKRDGVLRNTVIDAYPNTTQFWKWTAQAYLAMPSYIDMRGKWAG